MDELTLRLDDNEELNALTLTTLLNSGVEEALSSLSPAELIQLEKRIQQRKRQKGSTTSVNSRTVSNPSSGGNSGRKRRLSNDEDLVSDRHIERPRPTGGQYMNLPASTPQVEFRDGTEWLIFTYSTKGHIQEYHIRADLDEITLDEIPEDFKAENCVYPRALVPREAYIGNRYEYETAVNDIAWKLCWRNPGVLCGKRGLIQRAVDSYRNRTPENRSRRVMRQEKLHQNSPFIKRGGVADTMDGTTVMGISPTPLIRVPGPKTLTLQYADREGELTKIKIRVDIEGVDLSQVDDDFRTNNAIFPQAMTGGPGYTTERWEYENACNELGWKLAWLNSAKLAGKRGLLHKAVEAYQSRVEAAERARQAVLHHHQQVLGQAAVYDPSILYGSAHGLHPHELDHSHGGRLGHVLVDQHGTIIDKNEEFSQMVAHTLQQALAQGVNFDHSHAGHQMLPFPHEIVDDAEFHDHHHVIHHATTDEQHEAFQHGLHHLEGVADDGRSHHIEKQHRHPRNKLEGGRDRHSDSENLEHVPSKQRH